MQGGITTTPILHPFRIYSIARPLMRKSIAVILSEHTSPEGGGEFAAFHWAPSHSDGDRTGREIS